MALDHASLFRQLKRDAVAWSGSPARLQRDEVVAWFGRRGWKAIGEGAFAKVCRRPGEDRVLKVFRLNRTAGDATLAYLKACRRGVNPLMPRVDAVTTVGQVGVAVMEFLASAEEWKLAHAVSRDMADHFRSRTWRARRFDPASLSKEAIRGEGRAFTSPDLVRLAGVLGRIRAATPGSRIDLNRGNSMVRVTPEGRRLVITDPLA